MHSDCPSIEPGGRKRRLSCGPLVDAALILLMLYVLSSGPVVWLVHHGYFTGDLWRSLYWPLFWLHNQRGIFGKALDWYVDLFAS